jgi:hypothetical protein
MLEEDATIMIALDPDFPAEDVQAIAHRISASGTLIPGFIPPDIGFLAFEALVYATYVDRAATVILPDLNIVSRMARVARDGIVDPIDGPTQTAIDVMALAQAMDFDIEPSIAFHELAYCDGNHIANEKLRWFRAADHGQANAWIDLALGRSSRITTIQLGPPTTDDLAAPIHRYRCNYAAALQVAVLELDSTRSPLARAKSLLEWMVSDFIVAGPAAIFAAMFLSPRASRAGMIKQLKSPNRARALAGIRNAAWDITHLSDFVRRSKTADYEKQRFIFATADQALAQLAQLLFIDAECLDEFERQLALAIVPWWGKDAPTIAKFIAEAIAHAEERLPPQGPPGVDDYVGHQIELGESAVRAVHPADR